MSLGKSAIIRQRSFNVINYNISALFHSGPVFATTLKNLRECEVSKNSNVWNTFQNLEHF